MSDTGHTPLFHGRRSMQPSCRQKTVPLWHKFHRYETMQRNYLVLATYIAAVLTGCSGHNHEHGEHSHEGHEHEEHAEHAHTAGEIVFSEEKAAAIGLETEVIDYAPFAEVIKVSGQILTPANKTLQVVAAMDGVITLQRTLNEGTPVRKGQVLAHISVRGMATADPVETARLQYEAASREYERASRLTGNQIVSAQEMEQITLRYRTAQTQYEALRDKKAEDGCIEVVAPQDGYVSGMKFANGDYVEAGDALLGVSQTKSLLLQADVPERYWNSLSKIQSANFEPAYSSTTYRLADQNGQLLSVGQSTNSQTGYVPVVFSFENKEGLIAGSYADVYLLLREKQQALSVPVSAVCEEQGIYSVYVRLDEDCYRKREIVLGQSNGERVLVRSGLQAGEAVVTNGAIQVKLAGSATVIPGHTHNH